MSAPPALWVSEADVLALMDMGNAISALKRGLLLEAHGQALNMTKTHISWGQGSTLHAIGAVFPNAGFVGTKTWAHTSQGAGPLFILFDSNDGSLRAVIEAFRLGQLRTGAISGIATERLASEEADEFAIIGTGKQAMTQVRAVLAVRHIRRIHVFGRDQERRAQFTAQVRKEFGVEAVAESTIEAAVRNAGIITLVTRAKEPILDASMIAHGTHINAVGAIVPGNFELARNVLERANMVVVDSVSQARKLSSELIEFCGQEEVRWVKLRSLADIMESGNLRSPNSDLTIFKSLGMGISDLSLAIELYEKAVKIGKGRDLAFLREVGSQVAH
jgi:alanine dehydrogenase